VSFLLQAGGIGKIANHQVGGEHCSNWAEEQVSLVPVAAQILAGEKLVADGGVGHQVALGIQSNS